MKSYELTYIISPEITAEETEAIAKEIESFLQQNEGVVLRYENPFPKVLSYRIKKQASGFLGILEFQFSGEKIKDLKEKLGKDSRILRHMITVKNPVKPMKEKRMRKKLITAEPEKASENKTQESKSEKKVELKEIEKKLDEILSE